MLIYLDEELAYDFGLQLQKIKEVYDTGRCSSFLWFEAVSIWNQDHSRAKRSLILRERSFISAFAGTCLGKA